MTLAGSIRLGLGFSACVGALILAVVWGQVPARYGPCPQDPANPYVIADCVLGPPLLVVILKLAIALTAIAGAAVLATRAAARLKVTIGAVAASFCSLFGLFAVNAVVAQTFKGGFVPSIEAVAVVACVFFLFGAIVALVTARWWPNNSLERTPER
jgi:hypothetical protein